uniref:NADH-ubiquinone oxidoreductase chain 4L n=1 Tax=Blastopsylla occidentalis TaxID=121832 RepID=A0A2U9QJH3_BLAOC|nr:NADH dehydrogenase subunit 4L [Blastopsylla occidentalis]AWU48866.1 NADH dehydrogenase subunit 4L [Blastopsylla occidentalis]
MFELVSFLVMFYLGMKTFFFNKKHILMMLLSLEMLSLLIMSMIIFILSIYNYDSMMIVYFIIILVCEAVIGLVLLTLIVRSHGSDYIKSFSMLLC